VKDVLVTGGCGFIGLNLIDQLIKSGCQVTIVDLPGADWTRVPNGVERFRIDILKPEELAKLPNTFDTVFHLAARTDLDGTGVSDYSVNYTGTENLIRQLKDCKGLRRFVFYSTQLVIGLFNETRFLDEREPYRTNTPYGESKILGEKATIKACSEANIPYTIIRPTSVYGPGGKAPYREFFATIRNHQYFHVGKASNLVSMVYVENLVALTLVAVNSPDAVNQVFMGNDLYPYTMREFSDQVARYYGWKIPTVNRSVATIAAYVLAPFKRLGFNVPLYPFRLRNITMNYCYDIQKSLQIGYWPPYGLTEGVKKTLDWYEASETFR
jgi:GlcNAc-P-P-Und epimerase